MFEALQIKGLFNIFASQTTQDVAMVALSNGNFSRQVIFKRNGLVAPIVNLVVTLDNGLITDLSWVNSCY
jgi:hypothetical protein